MREIKRNSNVPGELSSGKHPCSVYLVLVTFSPCQCCPPVPVEARGGIPMREVAVDASSEGRRGRVEGMVVEADGSRRGGIRAVSSEFNGDERGEGAKEGKRGKGREGGKQENLLLLRWSCLRSRRERRRRRIERSLKDRFVKQGRKL
jgi:hypothetical protein